MEIQEFSQQVIDKYDEEEIERITSLMKEQLEIKDRKYHSKTYKNCFIGRDMVNWLLEHEYGENVEEALEIGNYIMSKDIFHHVCRDHVLKNKKLYYIFYDHEKNRGHLLDNSTWQNVGEEKDGQTLSPEEVGDVLDQLSDWPQKNSEMGQILFDKHNRETLDNCRPLNWVDPEIEDKYDMIAIGGGTGGIISALGGAIAGGRAAMIERNIVGGDCLNTGGVPSKAFIKAAKVAHTVKSEAEKYGVNIKGKVKIDFDKVMDKVREARAEVSEHDSVYKFSK